MAEDGVRCEDGGIDGGVGCFLADFEKGFRGIGFRFENVELLGEKLAQEIELARIRLASGEAEERGGDAGVRVIGVVAENHFGERAGRLDELGVV